MIIHGILKSQWAGIDVLTEGRKCHSPLPKNIFLMRVFAITAGSFGLLNEILKT